MCFFPFILELHKDTKLTHSFCKIICSTLRRQVLKFFFFSCNFTPSSDWTALYEMELIKKNQTDKWTWKECDKVFPTGGWGRISPPLAKNWLFLPNWKDSLELRNFEKSILDQTLAYPPANKSQNFAPQYLQFL